MSRRDILAEKAGARFASLAIVFACCAWLAACASSPPAPSGPFSEISLDTGAAQTMISAYRRAHGLATVTVDPRLERVAQAQADAMAAADFLSHEVHGSLPARLEAAEVPRGSAVENVSAGYATMADVFGGWRRSPPHNANLLDPPMRRMGVAAAEAPGTRYKRFWALVMTD